MAKNEFIDVLGYKIFKGTLVECVGKIENYEKVNIISGNPEVLYTGLQNEDLLKEFKGKNALIIPDGVGLQLAAKYLKTPVTEKIAGIDLMKSIVDKCEKENRSIYLLGSTEEVIKECVINLKTLYPKVEIAGYRNGFFDLDNAEDIVSDINKKKPYAVFVAMGCPRQEKFITKYIDKIDAKVFMGVGGSFDVIADKVKRAPKWMINIGMEWAYRVAKEPWRIKRLGSIPKFLLTVARNKGK